jgi:hypothetical protein
MASASAGLILLQHKQRFALIARVAICAVVLIAWWYGTKSQDPASSDATADWVVMKAVGNDTWPLVDIRTLARQVGVPYTSPSDARLILHYRPPGGLLLLYPLTAVDWQFAHVLMSTVGLFFFLWLLLVQVPQFCKRPIESLAFPLVLAAMSIAFIESSYWGTVSCLVAVSTYATMCRIDRPFGSWPLAVATTLKLYPGLVFVPLLIKRRSVWASGVGLIALLTAGGLLAFDLSPTDALRLLGDGSRLWLTRPGNVALISVLFGEAAAPAAFVAVLALGTVAVIGFSMRRPLRQSLALAVAVSVLISPVSWAHYGVILIPLVIWLWSRGRRYKFGGYVAFTWLAVEASALAATTVGGVRAVQISILIVRLLVAAAIGFAPSSLWETQETHDPMRQRVQGLSQIEQATAAVQADHRLHAEFRRQPQ